MEKVYRQGVTAMQIIHLSHEAQKSLLTSNNPLAYAYGYLVQTAKYSEDKRLCAIAREIDFLLNDKLNDDN